MIVDKLSKARLFFYEIKYFYSFILNIGDK